jgi:hypothetical protein
MAKRTNAGAPVEHDPNPGLHELIGHTVTLICAVYIYAGKLVAVGPSAVKLEEGELVYETGPWDKKTWADAQRLPFKHTYVSTGMIESYGVRETP